MAEKIKSVAVFCGARNGNFPHYRPMAYQLGQRLAENNLKLVYGGGCVGLMGDVATGCMRSGGYVIGVIPEALVARELALKECQELYEVESMHARKALMADKAEAFMAIPGGFGTLDEIFEIITWRQLQFHKKPIIFLNHQGYFDSLIEFCQKMKHEGFIGDADWQLIEVYKDVDEWLKAWQEQKRI